MRKLVPTFIRIRLLSQTPMKLSRILLSVIAASLCSLPCSAAPVSVVRVDDPFTDGGLTNGADPLDTNWSVLSYGGTLLLATAPFAASGNTSNALVFNSNYQGSGAFPFALGGNFTSQVLNVVGDSITLTFDFRLTTAIPNSSGAIRFGLSSSSNTYGFLFGSGTSASRGMNVYPANTISGTGTALTTSGNPIAIGDSGSHSFRMTLTRTAANTLAIEAVIDGVNSYSATHTGVTNFLFNRIILGEGGVNNLDFNLDNAKVTTLLEPWNKPIATFAPATVSANLGVNTGVVSMQMTDADFQKMQAAKVKYVRADLTWGAVENGQPGVYNWNFIDTFVAKTQQYGLNIIWVLGYNNGLYETLNPSDHKGITTDAGRNGFANYAAAAVARYDRPGMIWEIWNEQNSDFWLPDHNPDNYMALINAAVPRMKQAKPNCLVVSGGVMDIAWAQTIGWLDRCFQLGLLNTVDGLGAHLYGGAANRNVERFPNELANLRAMITSYGAPANFPILDTEFGTDVSEYNGDYNQQAQTCARSYLLHFMCDLQLDIWYEWRRPSTTSGMALLNSDGTVRPAYNALKTLTTQLEGYSYERRETLASTSDYALIFQKGTQRKMAVWTSSWTAHAATIPVSTSATSLATVNMTGTPGTINVVNGTISPTISQAPIYVDLAAGTGSGAVIVDDSFTDGGLTNGTDALDIPWYSMASTAVLGVGAFNSSGNTTSSLVLNNTRSGNTGPFPYLKGGSYLIPALAVGQSATLSFSFRITGTIPSSGSALRFALGSGSSTYALTFGTGTSAGGGLTKYGPDIVSGTGTSLATGGSIAINDNSPHTFSMTLTRSSTGLSVSASVDTATMSGSETGVSNFTFDRVVLGQGGVDNLDLTIDNVKVERN